MKHERLKKLISLAMLSSLAFLMTFVSRFLPGIVLFLKYDPKDIIVAVGGFIFGPFSAFVIAFISSLIEMFTVSETGWIGLLMNVLSSSAFACTAAAIYSRKKTFSSAVKGIICGALAMTASMILWNYFVTPVYMQVEREYVAKLLLPAFLPFNLLKAGLNAAFTVILYKPVITSLRNAGLVKKNPTSGDYKIGTLKRSRIIFFTALGFALIFAGLMVVLHFYG